MIFLCVFYKEFTVDDYFIKREFRIKVERLARDGQMSISRFPIVSSSTQGTVCNGLPFDSVHVCHAPHELFPRGPQVAVRRNDP